MTLIRRHCTLASDSSTHLLSVLLKKKNRIAAAEVYKEEDWKIRSGFEIEYIA